MKHSAGVCRDLRLASVEEPIRLGREGSVSKPEQSTTFFQSMSEKWDWPEWLWLSENGVLWEDKRIKRWEGGAVDS